MPSLSLTSKKKNSRLGFAVILALVLFCLAFEQFSTYRLMSEIDMSNRKIVLNYATQTAVRIQDKFSSLDTSLQALEGEIASTGSLDLKKLLAHLRAYETIWKTDASGVLLDDGRVMLSDGTLLEPENKIQLNDVSSYSEQLHISKQVVRGKNMLLFAKPFAQRVEGYEIVGIFTAIHIQWLDSLLGERGYGNRSFLALIQDDGSNIWKQGSPFPNSGCNAFDELDKLDMRKSDSVLQMKTRIKVSLDGTLIYQKDGQEYYLAYVPLHVNYWYLIVSTKSDSIDYTTLSRQYYTTAGVLLAAVVIMGLFGILYLVQRNRSITEHNEKLQRATQLANQANEAKRDFLAKVSHEIRTPLNGVIGMLELAKKCPAENGKYLDYLDKATISAAYLLGLINDVLDMSQIESGKLRLVRKTFAIEQLNKELETVVETSVRQKRLRFTLDDTQLQHRHFVGDYLRLKQILMNLLSNAIKYTPEEGTILLKIDEEPGDGVSRVRFLVKDSGQGIAPEKRARIFEPFEQGDSSDQSRKSGVGLGLSIVKNIVQLMDGTIEVESAAGEGSSFIVTLPLEARQASEEIQAKTQATNLQGISILLAEDNALNAEIAIELLQDDGATVTWVQDGDEAIANFAQSPPHTYHVILMDIQMPHKNGIEATKEIRKLPRADAVTIPIVALTANAFAEQKEEMENAGMNDFLYKPIDMDKVRLCIQKCTAEDLS